jgi:hypothetical protein
MSQMGFNNGGNWRALGPLHLNQPTLTVRIGTSRLCQKATFALQQIAPLFDHLVGAGEHYRRNGEAQVSSGLEIDYEFELYGLLDRKVARRFPLENPVHIARRATIEIGIAYADDSSPPASANSLAG